MVQGCQILVSEHQSYGFLLLTIQSSKQAFTGIQKKYAGTVIGAPAGETGATSKAQTPKKRAAAKSSDEDGDGDETPKTKTPKNRAAAGEGERKGKKVKTEEGEGEVVNGDGESESSDAFRSEET